MPDAEFHIYGDGPVRPALEEMTRQRGLNGLVQFKEGLPLKEIAPVIAAADVGVVPKRAEGFGNEAFSTKILEFMACGVPVIVSRTRVDTHYFDDTLVRFFKSGDEVDLAQAMLWVYEHRKDNQAWRQRARDFAVRNSWQERCADYLNLVTPAR
jgi:glycosyltransferase involved in cell wall biosynthesis